MTDRVYVCIKAKNLNMPPAATVFFKTWKGADQVWLMSVSEISEGFSTTMTKAEIEELRDRLNEVLGAMEGRA